VYTYAPEMDEPVTNAHTHTPEVSINIRSFGQGAAVRAQQPRGSCGNIPHSVKWCDHLTVREMGMAGTHDIAIKKVDCGSQRSREGLDMAGDDTLNVCVQPIPRGERPCPSLACPSCPTGTQALQQIGQTSADR
jgi:hypothetical protein